MTDLSKQRLKTWIRILGVTRSAESKLRDYLRREHATTLPRFDVMAALWRKHDGVTMSELSRMLLVSNGNATAVVDRLEADGMAQRAAEDGDRRRIRVRLTPAGLAAFEAMAHGHEAQVDALFANLTQNDLDTMRAILSRAGGTT